MWTSTNSGSGTALNWQAGCSVVTTNCSGNYANNQNTMYTSPTINASCMNASSLGITFSASGNAENGYDFLFIEYSLNNGVTWINPYGAGVGWTGNFGGGATIPAVNCPTSSTFKFRFTFQSDFSNKYSGYKITGFNIWCNTVLPVELLYFNADKASCHQNMLTWSTVTETNNHHFDVESSSDGINFVKIKEIQGAINSMNIISYSYLDPSPTNGLNYYRLKQVDMNGMHKYSDIVSVDNSCIEHLKILKVCNLLGQEVENDYEGIYITYYDDGTVIKSMNK
jgi:hypothetical protein